MQNVTTKKFAEMCSVSDANIRGLIGRGKLTATRDAIGNHLLDIEDPANREYLNLKRNSSQEQSLDVRDLTKQNTQLDINAIERITQRIEELAKEAGEAKRLTDNLLKEEQSAKEWQDKYFELQHTCDSIRKEKEQSSINYLEQIAELKSRIAVLEAENLKLNDQVNKKWWKLGK